MMQGHETGGGRNQAWDGDLQTHCPLGGGLGIWKACVNGRGDRLRFAGARPAIAHSGPREAMTLCTQAAIGPAMRSDDDQTDTKRDQEFPRMFPRWIQRFFACRDNRRHHAKVLFSRPSWHLCRGRANHVETESRCDGTRDSRSHLQNVPARVFDARRGILPRRAAAAERCQASRREVSKPSA